jgi:ATP synthase protein I
MPDPHEEDPFVRAVRRQAEQALQGRRLTFWRGLGLIGTIGWMVSAPAVLGALAGRWLDRQYASGLFWTLSLLTLGMAAGCTSAWRSVQEELKRNSP